MKLGIRERFIGLYAHPGKNFLRGQLVPVLLASAFAIPVALVWFDWAGYVSLVVLFVLIQVVGQVAARAL